ncbi:N-6 DNA methylase [Idiomarina sp. HP20-50]|uniref:N-6 DNA methylase n=1 Tax=Idiomarina sp. HP20-50 TaxID=3070813 RepID=UPI00294AE05A|nr:N-6 DNA methylase [Idiomarina sp. HP20-50]MDV6316252.1 N-6 DNA methylase [Idiomarina sp. HP20-50]
MTVQVVKKWLDAWGYSAAADALYCDGEEVRPEQPYRPEILELLDGPIQAKAVFSIDDMPTICFLDGTGENVQSTENINSIRERVWNQNLISIVLVVDHEKATAIPVNERSDDFEVLPFDKANHSGAYSRRDFEAGELFLRHPDWFRPEMRVDQLLLRNLSRIVKDFQAAGLEKIDSQYLVSQVLFVAYLEHRDIINDSYRRLHGLERLDLLVANNHRKGIVRLIEQLKVDFNGDFLEPGTGAKKLWMGLPEPALQRLNEFLENSDLDSGQQSLWKFDFRYIPVELISGIYESFLTDDRRNVGAYYTPRHLAVLAVDQALSLSSDILSERIFDGACGSGILLTTAYRRMLAVKEAKEERRISFSERKKLLEKHIFGADLSVPACRVTAFSLYLSMLEGMQPEDISLLTSNAEVKLPTLRGQNLFAGEIEGDFFSDSNGHLLADSKFTIALSNPPWIEPDKEEWLQSDEWAKKIGIHLPRRQTAAAFMYRVKDFLEEHGKVCLILPVSVMAAATSQKFLSSWLQQYRLLSLTNFGDLRKLLFEDAKQPCVIACAETRQTDECWVDGSESFEYWVPKADISYAFGRLTLHASDRHRISTRYVVSDNSILTTLFWGTRLDLSLITKLQLKGSLGTLLQKDARWITRKGFHAKDSGVKNPEPAEPLRAMPFLDAKRFDASLPVLDRETLSTFPERIQTVAKIPAVPIFEGPRILFVDGLSSMRGIRAIFSDESFSFKSSIGVIKGSDSDANILRFISAFLNSSLATYILMLTAYQINFERERITLTDMKKLPFVPPEKHDNPLRAREIIQEVSDYLKHLEQEPRLLQAEYNRGHVDSQIFEYFGLNINEQNRVREVADRIAPNIQPGSYQQLSSPLTVKPTRAALVDYVEALVAELERRRDVRNGRGMFNVEIHKNRESTCGPLGIIRVSVSETTENTDSDVVLEDDLAVDALVRAFSEHGLLPLAIHQNFYLATDAVIRFKDAFYLVKPLVSRLWMTGEAHKDVDRVVDLVDEVLRQEVNGADL